MTTSQSPWALDVTIYVAIRRCHFSCTSSTTRTNRLRRLEEEQLLRVYHGCPLTDILATEGAECSPPKKTRPFRHLRIGSIRNLRHQLPAELAAQTTSRFRPRASVAPIGTL